VLQAADAGKLGIGVDSNQNYLHPGSVLTSMLKRVDVAVYHAFKDGREGRQRSRPGITVLGLAEDGVGYSLDDNNKAIELIGIDKSFGAGPRQQGHRPDGRAGTIHGIVGENGAGKSTLMSILYGFYQADSGEIRVNGKPRSIRDARRREAIAPASAWSTSTSCWSTISPCSRTSCSAPRAARCSAPGSRGARRAGAARARIRLEVDPDAVIEDLPVGLQQRVEILKALYRGAEILILDEPTGVLTPAEADHLFRILAAARRARRSS
jgi:ABC-type multidrug transport system ATPase subunit